jgi:hypothetical protein
VWWQAHNLHTIFSGKLKHLFISYVGKFSAQRENHWILFLWPRMAEELLGPFCEAFSLYPT